MTPDERNLIMGLFDRMRAQGSVPKEYEAEQLINSQVRQIPDSAYMMVQSVLVGEQTLNATAERIQQLEGRIRELEAKGAQQSSGGSFLGGLFGGGGKSAATSVPASRSAAPANSPWGQSSQPQYQQPQYQQPPMQGGYAQPAPARAGGGFMAQAMTTAAGVAGGMLAANAISNMMGGHHGHGSSGSVASVDQSGADAAQDAREDQQLAQDSQQDGQQDQQQYASDESNDPGVSDTADSGWGGGSDSSDA